MSRYEDYHSRGMYCPDDDCEFCRNMRKTGERLPPIHGILPDFEIARIPSMIEPFVDHQVRDDENGRVISYGLSSFGYDIRLANEFMRSPVGSEPYILDPKHTDGVFESFTESGRFVLTANSFILGRSVEYITVPKDIEVICIGKSTLCRMGIFANISPLEAGWCGTITIEIANLGNKPVWIYPNEGIAQLLFFRAEVPCKTSYADRHGKYQGQMNVTPSKV